MQQLAGHSHNYLYHTSAARSLQAAQGQARSEEMQGVKGLYG